MSQRPDWIVYPWQIDAAVQARQTHYPELVSVKQVSQYTRHKVHAITVGDGASKGQKAKHLFFVPHAHEPAGTAGCINFISQLLTGKHADGTPSTLQRGAILSQMLLTFIPDGNPYGRARSPEPVWEGRRYNNREFINLVFGMGDVYSLEPTKPKWERFKRVASFNVETAPPQRIGIVYEQVSEHDYVEPGRFDPRSSLSKLLEQLVAEHHYDQVLNIHQTEFEDAPETNCKVVLPAQQEELPEPRQHYNTAWGQSIHDIWREVGGRPPERFQIGFRYLDSPMHLHRQMSNETLRHALEKQTAFLTLEIQNNSPITPAEQQLLLVDTAIWRSVEFLLSKSAVGAPDGI